MAPDRNDPDSFSSASSRFHQQMWDFAFVVAVAGRRDVIEGGNQSICEEIDWSVLEVPRETIQVPSLEVADLFDIHQRVVD